jgi:hypothetical protein
MLNSKYGHNKFLQAANTNTLAKRIDDDVAKSMPNICQSIPSSALVRQQVKNLINSILCLIES